MITAQRLIKSEIPTLSKGDDPVRALSLMDEFRIVHLPVTEGGKYLGVISETALLASDGQLGPTEDLLDISVTPEEHVLDVLRIAGEYHVSIIPVINHDRQLLGVITLEDLVENLSSMQGANKPGGIIVLEMAENDYSLQQIARIVEENDAKILSLSVNTGEMGKIEVNLKINEPDLNPILQSLIRFGYTIQGSYQEPEYTEDLKKRYDELMRYLNI
ncbi:MAG: CBS domain-containing protein [Flavobacteriales bacterium]